MTLTSIDSFKQSPVLYGEINEDGEVVGSTQNAEALALTVTAGVSEANDWTYSATAEDNGTAGILDAQPGLTYSGPSGNIFRVQAVGMVVTDGTTLEETDKAVSSVYVNSEVVNFSEEGFTAIEETTVTHNLRGKAISINEGDVVRFAITFTGEEDDVDVDIAVTPFIIAS